MISVAEALQLIDENSSKAEPKFLALHEAAGLVLAKDIYSTVDIPAYPQSSMDGYALSYLGWKKGTALQLAGEIAAGSNYSIPLLPNQAIRIFTGAAVPAGADTVVIQEKSKIFNGELIIEDENLKPGDNVRSQGSEIKKDSLALEAGTVLSPASIGFLAGMGLAELPVYPKPIISIIVTGNELQTPGQPLQYGQVYEANSFSLAAALEQFKCIQVLRYRCNDHLDSLSALLAEALDKTDMVLLTGGVSVGDYDFTIKAAEQCGVRTLFHKIKQKPGKPIFFGKKSNKLVFGLPGNPASVLTCFYLYVAPALEKFMNVKQVINKVTVSLGSLIRKPSGITWFLKGYYENGIVNILDAQESFRLSSFARANCLVQVNEDQIICNPGDPVTIHLLP